MMVLYDKMKEKYKKEYDEIVHFNNLFLSLISMFEWKGLPDTIRPDLLEKILIGEGTAAVAKIDGELYTGVGSYCGDTKNFLPTSYHFVTVGIGEYEGVVGETCAVCWNNSILVPDFSLYQYASRLAEIDVSERCNVLFSRLLRIPRVKDSKEKTAIEECVKSILSGTFTATVSRNIQDELFTDTSHPDSRFLDLTDVSSVDKLQYLNQYRDNVIKRWFQMYGQGMQTTPKLAQQTTEELHGSDGVSMILPLDRLKCRQRFCEDMNSLFGTSVSVDFSDSYKESYEEMLETYSDGTKETSPEEGGAEK